MFKTAVQRGRSERRPEAYAFRYVEDLSDARTKFGERRISVRRGWAGEDTVVFNILLALAKAFLEGFEQRAEEIFDHPALSGFNFDRHGHPGGEVDLLPCHLNR